MSQESNHTNAPLEISNFLKNLTHSSKEYLQYHQFIVNQYFINFPHARGLLIQHPPGTGKTVLASSIAIHFANQGEKVIILTPKSLQDNFKNGIKQYVENTKIDNINNDNFTYLSLNANNVLDQVGRIDQTEVNKRFEKSLGDLGDIIKRGNKLDDSLLIIDEAHNLSNGVTNGSKNAVGLYDLILEAKNLKVILLTGTPIVNDAYELGILFNMIKGYIYDGKIRTTLFPEIRNEFNEYFVDKKTMNVKNIDMFTNRVYGLSTYYGPFYETAGKKTDIIKRKNYPDEYRLIVETVPMSSEQFSRYDFARTKEKEESASGYKPIVNVRFEKKSGSSTYRIASRQISNYVIPMYALGDIQGKKARKKFINKITVPDLVNLNKFSPKFKKLIENINKHPGIAVVHSDFVSGEGINLFALVLDQIGYTQWSPKTTGGAWFYNFGPGSGTYAYNDDSIYYGGKSKKYAVLTGNVDPEDRTKILQYINTKQNKKGDLLKILLISSAGSEGISVFNARSIHLMSSMWNYAAINQIIARVIRLHSHDDLPASERNVQPYIYLSDYPSDYKDTWEKENKKRKDVGGKMEIWEETTDITLFYKSIKQKRLNDYFLAASIRASIDCPIHTSKMSTADKKRINCLICKPTNAKLYHPVIPAQLKLPNPCATFERGKQIKAKEIIVNLDGQKQKFLYTFDKETKKIIVLERSESLGAYMPLSHDHQYYHDIYAILEDKLL